MNFWRRNLERLFLSANLLTYVISIIFPFLQLIRAKSLSGWFILIIFSSSIIISFRNFHDNSFPPFVLSRTLKHLKWKTFSPDWRLYYILYLSEIIFSSSSVNTWDFLPRPVYFLSAFTRSRKVLLAMLNFLDASDNVLHSPLRKIGLQRHSTIYATPTSLLRQWPSHTGFVFVFSHCFLLRVLWAGLEPNFLPILLIIDCW